MKKIFIICSCLILCFLLNSCDNAYKPTYDISDRVKKAGIKAVEIVDKYLEFEIDEDKAQEQLESIYERCPEQKEDDFFVKSDINHLAFCVGEIDNPEPSYYTDLNDEDYTTVKTRELVIERNDLAASYLELKPVDVPYSVKPEKVNLSDLCEEASTYENKIITTTIYVNNIFGNEYSYDFELEDYDSASISFDTVGFECKAVSDGYMTITGCVSFTNTDDDFFSIDIDALDNNSVLDTVDESLFTDMNEE